MCITSCTLASGIWRRRQFRVADGSPVLSRFLGSIWDMGIGGRIAPFDTMILFDFHRSGACNHPNLRRTSMSL